MIAYLQCSNIIKSQNLTLVQIETKIANFTLRVYAIEYEKSPSTH